MQNSSQHSEVVYQGQIGQLYKLWITNFLLNIITLGIFSFWGKTRVRRYVISNTRVKGERLEYTGTGGELFLAFLMAVVAVIVLSIPLFLAYQQLKEFTQSQTDLTQPLESIEQELEALENAPNTEGIDLKSTQRIKELKDEKNKIEDELFNRFVKAHPGTTSLFAVYLLVFLFYLPFMARYGMLIYQASHIRWRGVRATQSGSAFLYPFVVLFHAFLTVITLTLWLPFAYCALSKYKESRLFFGNQRGVHQPKKGKVFKSHILTMLLFVFTLGISRFWFRAALARMRVNDFRINDITFNTTMTGGNLFKLKLGNALILIFTLFLGYPVVLHRNMAFMARHTHIEGNLETLNIEQAKGQPPLRGEGLSHWLDIGARFGTGYLILYY